MWAKLSETDPAVSVVLNVYSDLAAAILIVHAIFILWVIFGALLTISRPILRWIHVASLVWGVLVELLPWPCPLTLLENWLEVRAGIQPYSEPFLVHYMDKIVYPDVSGTVLTIAGVMICCLNLGFYARQIWRKKGRHEVRVSPDLPK